MGWGGMAPEALLGFFPYQPKQAEFLWSVELMTHRRPDYFNPVRRRALPGSGHHEERCCDQNEGARDRAIPGARSQRSMHQTLTLRSALSFDGRHSRNTLCEELFPTD